MFINEIGCWIRSRLLGLPFGDQGFCLSRIHFERIGGFPEDVAYGEDHVFVWRAKQNGIALKAIKAILKTSARRYRDQGWLKTTLLFYKLWTRQARAERKKLNLMRSGQATAIAVFVKTPGLTPLKTRLARTIGQESSMAFYELCLKAIEEKLARVRRTMLFPIFPHWAVAEQTGLSDPHWNAFSRIGQGDGSLGERLHNVYSALFSTYGRVVLIGTDTPQLPENLILQTHGMLKNKNRFVIGPARDGGFYLFGGSASLPKEVWTSVAYSQAKTCEELAAKLKDYGEIVFLPLLTDVDVYDDLKILKHELQNQTDPTQKAILNWIETAGQREALWA
jgi:rSAM/selenodomain-associated transferase 1